MTPAIKESKQAALQALRRTTEDISTNPLCIVPVIDALAHRKYDGRRAFRNEGKPMDRCQRRFVGESASMKGFAETSSRQIVRLASLRERIFAA